jgi:hypothetical protein
MTRILVKSWGRHEHVMEPYEVTGIKVYQLNVCDDQRSPFVLRNHNVASDQIE